MPIFVIEARWTPDALSRIVLLFHRRRVSIDSLVAQRNRETDLLRIEVQIEAVEGQAELIEANLYKLIDVLLVESKSVDREIALHTDKDGQHKR
jgi:acetolactate synthase I/III small subunit